jgi:Fur family transcriptional regulator, peroxide stress response regulator
MRSIADVTERLRRNGMRVTPQRYHVLSLLSAQHAHPTVRALYEAAREAMPSVSLRTVYQVVHDLEKLGELHLVHLDDAGARIDVHNEPHHHLVCETCGRIVDTDLDVDGLEVPESAALGFTVGAIDVIVHGHCSDCAERF